MDIMRQSSRSQAPSNYGFDESQVQKSTNMALMHQLSLIRALDQTPISTTTPQDMGPQLGLRSQVRNIKGQVQDPK